MVRLVLVATAVAAFATACASATPTDSASEATSVAAESSGLDDSPQECRATGCPVPDCGEGQTVHASIDHGASAVGTHAVEADLKEWIESLVGGGEGTGIPTPQNKIAFLVRRDDTDLALLWYVSDGSGGWLRVGYTACASALQS